MKKYFVYILRCRDGDSYIGFTKNLRRRIVDHQCGSGCLYTKNKLPIRLVYYEIYGDFIEAKKRENQIKSWRREKKENLIKYGKPIR